MSGFIGIIGGPMRCDSWIIQHGFYRGEKGGKTGFLLDVMTQAEIDKETALAIQSHKNIRDGVTQLKDKRGRSCWAVTATDMGLASAALKNKAAVVCIDEAHFWSPQHLSTAAESLKERGVTVWIAGIDIDHHGAYFDWWTMLSSVADTAVTFSGQCYGEHAPATHTFRYHLDEGRTRAGEAEYESMCKDCFEIGMDYRRWRWRVIQGIFPAKTAAKMASVISSGSDMAIGGGYGG